MISLAALRNTTSPHAPVKLTASSRVDFTTRLAAARANRGAPRVLLTTTSVPPTTTTIAPPPTTAKPVVKAATVTTVKKPTPTTAKPKPTPTTAKPAAPTNTPTTVSPRPMPTGGSTTNGSEEGRASWYDAKYHASNPWICAHKTLPMGTIVTVTNVNTGATVKCEVGDRGPYVDGRVLDMSKYAFSRIANPSSGLVWVKLSW